MGHHGNNGGPDMSGTFWNGLVQGNDRGAMRAILDAVPHMVWSTRPDGYHDFYNRRWYDFTGAPHRSTDGEAWNGMFHPEDRDHAWALWENCLQTGEPYEVEYRLRHYSGEYRWTLGRAFPVRDESGAIVRWFGTCTDVDDLKRAEGAIELVAGELAHRINNIFAVLLSLLSATARHRPESQGFAKHFGDKVRALAKAHGMVRLHAGPGGAGQGNLIGLIEALAAPYQLDSAHVIDIGGDDTVLGVKAAGALALVIHELATNALKYGALSVPEGAVTLRSRVDGETLRLDWVESGGPPVCGEPQHTGFGTDMKRRAVAQQLRGDVREDWHPAGLRVTLTFPLDALKT